MPMHTTYDVFRVDGMSCAHCVGAVTDHLSKMDGVLDVAVNLAAQTVTVASIDPLEFTEIKSAMAAVGHRLAG